jgi:hypothetical protein
MTAFDYSDASDPVDYELVPDGLVATVQARVRQGDSAVLKYSKDGRSQLLDLEFILVDTKHAKMKFWQNLLIDGETDGHKQMGERSKSLLKAALDSAHNLKPDDRSPEARAKRKMEFSDFDGLRFLVKIGIEKGKKKDDGSYYKDRNIIAMVITPDKPGYHPVEQSGSPSGGSSLPAAPAAPVVKPKWAQ